MMRLLIFVVLIELALSHLNVFINQREVMKLLGLDAELYYVSDGVINSYAMNFTVLVPAHISELEFSWQSLINQPLPYLMTVLYDNQGALLPPQVNITERGTVPITVQTFRVLLPCTGLKNAEIEVHIQLNITSTNRKYEDIWLNFKRNKICLKKDIFDKDSMPISPRNDSVRLAADSLVTAGGTFYVAVGSALAMISMVAVAISTRMYLRTKKARNHDSMQSSYTAAAYYRGGGALLRLEALGRPGSATSGSYATIASLHKVPIGRGRSPSPYATTRLCSEPPVYSTPIGFYSDLVTTASQVSRGSSKTDRIRRLIVQRSDVALGEVIHEGTFGRMLKGKLRRDADQLEVVVKTVSDVATKIQISLLLSEGLLLANHSHENLLTPLGVCMASGSLRPLLVYPFASYGNLKKFLLERRCGVGAGVRLVALAVGAARGLVYLHAMRILHRDVATRNCVVDENLQVKITDNALSRDLFPEDYHCLCDSENRPIKWMALEALQHAEFSTASDVWSFGVLLWELATFAQQPYAEVDPFEVVAFLRDGYRLSQPVNCPDELFTVMSCCWLSAMEARPSLVQLLAFLQDFQTALAQYI